MTERAPRFGGTMINGTEWIADPNIPDRKDRIEIWGFNVPEFDIRPMTEPTHSELHLGDRVAIADGSAMQGARGHVTELEGHGVLVHLDDGQFHRVAWWKDVQLLNDDAPA